MVGADTPLWRRRTHAQRTWVGCGLCLLLPFPSLSSPPPNRVAPSDAFLKYWKSGLAEISTYGGQEERYGSLRNEVSTLIFVYEEIDSKTRIKVESPKVPLSRQVPVLKLNRLQHFNTGLYDYSVMTSVFSGLTGPGVQRPFDVQKVALTVQEWCGLVYQQAIPRGRNLNLTWHSYFESEGEGQRSIPIPAQAVYEDELPILLRELDGPWMQPGDSMQVSLYPREWRTRKRHQSPKFEPATIVKSSELKYVQSGRNQAAFAFTVRAPWDTTVYYVETQSPQKLLAWHASTGAYAEWQHSVRKTYWLRNRPEHEPLRDELSLPHQPTPPPKGKVQP
jgi:hypothetical protein